MRVLYWAAGQARYTYAPVVIRFPYRELVYESAKNRALQWENLQDWLLEQGKNPKLFNEIDTYNLEVLRENAQMADNLCRYLCSQGVKGVRGFALADYFSQERIQNG